MWVEERGVDRDFGWETMARLTSLTWGGRAIGIIYASFVKECSWLLVLPGAHALLFARPEIRKDILLYLVFQSYYRY